MSAPRKFDEETRARAVRLYTDRLRDHGESKLAARRHVGQLLDIKPATLRNWIEADERAARPDSGNSADDAAELRRLRQEVASSVRNSRTGSAPTRPDRPGTTNSADDATELRRLRAENAELRRANEILKTASAFFAQAELDRRLK